MLKSKPKLLSLLLLTLCFYAKKSTAQTHKTIWTEAYALKWSNQLDSEIKPRVQDEIKRKAILSYCITRLKEALPNGIESVSTDSVGRLFIKIGKDYALLNYDHTGIKSVYHRWDKEIETGLRESLMRGISAKNYKKESAACDCFFKELKRTYPDSILLPIPRDIIRATTKKCKEKTGL
jgi:hypothetical protein